MTKKGEAYEGSLVDRAPFLTAEEWEKAAPEAQILEVLAKNFEPISFQEIYKGIPEEERWDPAEYQKEKMNNASYR